MNVRKKTVIVFLVASLTVTGAALSSFSAPFVCKSVSAASSIDSLTSDAVSSVEMILANEIGKALGITVPLHDISSMQHHNLGYGEIALAYNLAHASGRSVDEILTMRLDQKMGWGKIAKTVGVKLHSAADRSVHILKQSKLDNEVDHFHLSIKADLDDEDDNGKNKGTKDKDNKSKPHSNSSNNDASKDNGNPHKPNQGKPNSGR